jgi:hypothetical protein
MASFKKTIATAKAKIADAPLIEHHRRENDGEAARQLSRLLIAEREKSLPAGVPLHKRGFGVMGEDGA